MSQWLCKKCGSINTGPNACWKCGPVVPVASRVAQSAKLAASPYTGSVGKWWRSLAPVSQIGVILAAILIMLFAWNQYLDLSLKLEIRADREKLAKKQRDLEAAQAQWERDAPKRAKEIDAMLDKMREPLRSSSPPKPNAVPPQPQYDYYGKEVKPGTKPEARPPSVPWGSQGN